MTVNIKFKLVDKVPSESGTIIYWVVGVSDGSNTSTGMGHIDVQESLDGMTDDEVIQLALNKQGGMKLVTDLKKLHGAALKPCLELQFFDDWYLAYAFACQKRGIVADNALDARQNMMEGFGTYGVTYNHSIFNVTDAAHWSHTFKYMVPEEFDPTVDADNDFGGTMYHIKVRGNEVVEWYKRSAALKFNGEQVDWVALDLVSGQVIEYYKSRVSESDGTRVMDKFDAQTNAISTSTTHAPPEELVLPAEFTAALQSAGFAHMNCIFGYAEKSYGKMVEYTLLLANNPTPTGSN